jgi:hypothetical protein
MQFENLDNFLGIFSVPVVWNGTTGLGIFDAPTSVMGGGAVLSDEYLVTVKTAVFGAVNYGDAITVNGTAYKVREARKIDDGAFTEITLSKV